MTKHAQRKGRISSRKIRRPIVIALIVAVFALGATAAVSLRGNQANSTTPPASVSATDARTNLRLNAGAPIPLNPQTGQVRPLTQEEAQRLAAGIKQLVNQSTEGLQEVKQADGTVSMDLQGHFQNVAVAKRTEDGELVQSCIDNRAAAAAFFGIDPELVSVKQNASAPRNAASQPKGGVR